jgi:hypothetical protein
MNTMNLQDHQQYVPSARENVDVITIGHVEIKSIQRYVDLTLNSLSAKSVLAGEKLIATYSIST